MKYISLSPTGPIVSKLCLGTVDYGTVISKDVAYKQMDYFFEHGGTFLDTAHVYGDWASSEKAMSEKVIGGWLHDRDVRDKVIISTKGGHPLLDSMQVSRLTPQDIQKDLEESLQTIGVDSIDLYFLHRDDPSIPVVEILAVLESLRKQGKIRHYGCSNWTLQRMIEADAEAMWNSFEGFLCNQLQWGIGDINLSGMSDKTMVSMDKKTYDYHVKTRKSVMAYMSVCKGYFSKKLHGSPVSDSLEALYDNPNNRLILGRFPRYKSVCGCPSIPISLAYLMSQPFPTVPIASFSSIEQLQEGVSACDLVIPKSIIAEIDSNRQYIYE